MARGIGGDDGPSLWMFLAVILVWAWLQKAAKTTKDTIVDKFEIGKNSAGVFQPETTKEIDAMNKFVAGIAVPWTKLKYKRAHYKSIADDCWGELKAVFNTDETKMFTELEPLTVYELKAVAKEFGVRETTLFGLTTETVTIFTAFDKVLTDGVFSKDLTRMRKIWQKTGLWV